MSKRKTFVPEPLVTLPKCGGCGVDLMGPSMLCGECLLGVGGSSVADAVNRLAVQMSTLPAGKPDWVHNFQGKCSANCPCDREGA